MCRFCFDRIWWVVNRTQISPSHNWSPMLSKNSNFRTQTERICLIMLLLVDAVRTLEASNQGVYQNENRFGCVTELQSIFYTQHTYTYTTHTPHIHNTTTQHHTQYTTQPHNITHNTQHHTYTQHTSSSTLYYKREWLMGCVVFVAWYRHSPECFVFFDASYSIHHTQHNNTHITATTQQRHIITHYHNTT